MENNFLKRKAICYFLENDNFELLKENDQQMIKALLENYTKNFVLFTFANGFIYSSLKIALLRPLKHPITRALLDFSIIISLTAFSKLLFDSKCDKELSSLNDLIKNNKYLLRNTLRFEAQHKTANSFNEENEQTSLWKLSVNLYKFSYFSQSTLCLLCFLHIIL